MKKKRNWGFTLVYILAGLIAVYVILTVSGAARLFNIPTSSNKPTLEVGDRVVVSKLVPPKRFDLIVYKIFDSLQMQKEFYVFRLCGMPGDVVEIKNGDLFVNGKLPGKKFDLLQPYNVPRDDVAEMLKLIEFGDDEFMDAGPHQNPLAWLSGKDCETLKKNNISVERQIIPREEQDQYIERVYGNKWNPDHFGPFTVPEGHYFVLGDNRTRANDSRYTGPIPISDFYGTVILH